MPARCKKQHFGGAVRSGPNDVPQWHLRHLLRGTLLQHKDPGRLQHFRQLRVFQQQAGELIARFRFLVGRIGKNNLEWLARRRRTKESKDILPANVALQFGPGQIPFDRRDRSGIFLHE